MDVRSTDKAMKSTADAFASRLHSAPDKRLARFMSELIHDIADLADRKHPMATLADLVEQCRPRRWNGKITPVSGAIETGLGRTHERPRDDPANIERVD